VVGKYQVQVSPSALEALNKTNLNLFLHSASQTVEMLVQMSWEHFVQTPTVLVTSITVHVMGRMNYATDEAQGILKLAYRSFS
jgi:hypothetical protein